MIEVYKCEETEEDLQKLSNKTDLIIKTQHFGDLPRKHVLYEKKKNLRHPGKK